MKTPSKKSPSSAYTQAEATQLVGNIRRAVQNSTATALVSLNTFEVIYQALNSLHSTYYLCEIQPGQKPKEGVVGKLLSKIPLMVSTAIPDNELHIRRGAEVTPVVLTVQRKPSPSDKESSGYHESTVKELFLRALIAHSHDPSVVLNMSMVTYRRMREAIAAFGLYTDLGSPQCPPFVFVAVATPCEGEPAGVLLSRKSSNISKGGVPLIISKAVPSGQAIIKGDLQNLRFIFDTVTFVDNEGSEPTPDSSDLKEQEWLSAESPAAAAKMLAQGSWKPSSTNSKFLTCPHSEFLGRKYLEIIPKISVSFPELAYSDIIFLMYLVEMYLPYPNLRTALRQYNEKSEVPLGDFVRHWLDTSRGLPSLRSPDTQYLSEIASHLEYELMEYLNRAPSSPAKEVSEEDLPIPNRKDLSLLESLSKGDETVAEELDRRANGQRFIVYTDMTYEQIDLSTSCALLKQARKASTPTEVNGHLVFRVTEVLSTVRVRFRCPICSSGILINDKCTICGISYAPFTQSGRERINVAARHLPSVRQALRDNPGKAMEHIEDMLHKSPSAFGPPQKLVVMERPWQTETLMKIIGGSK